MPDDCLFCRIISGEIPADQVLSNEHVLAFRDIDPQAPTHALVIPKKHVVDADHLSSGDGALLGALFDAAAEVAKAEGLSPDGGGKGYRLVFNVGSDVLNSGAAPTHARHWWPSDDVATRLIEPQCSPNDKEAFV